MNWLPVERLSPADRKEVKAQEQQDRLSFRMYRERKVYLRRMTAVEAKIFDWPPLGYHVVIILKDTRGNIQGHAFKNVPDDDGLLYLKDHRGDPNGDFRLLAAFESINRQTREKIGINIFPVDQWLAYISGMPVQVGT